MIAKALPGDLYRVRSGEVDYGTFKLGNQGYFVQNGETGANETPNILRMILPPKSPFLGIRKVSERQAKILAYIANHPDKSAELVAYLRARLAEA